MKTLQLLYFTGIGLLLHVSGNSQSIFDYTFNATTENYTALQNATQLTNNIIWDEETFKVPLGFTFYLDETPFDTVSVHSDGYISFLNTVINKRFIGIVIGNADLQDRGVGTLISESPISYQVDGVLGSQIMKIEYSNAGFFDGNANDFINFQIWIYESLDKIEYHIGSSLISTPNFIFQGNDGPICGLYKVNSTNNLHTGFCLTNSAIFPDTTQFYNLDPFNTPSLNDLIPENTVYVFANNHPVATKSTSREELNFTILSNPTNDVSIIVLELTRPNTVYIEVFDMNGKQLKKEGLAYPHGTYRISLDLSKYPAATYLCKVRVGKKIAIRRIVKL